MAERLALVARKAATVDHSFVIHPSYRGSGVSTNVPLRPLSQQLPEHT